MAGTSAGPPRHWPSGLYLLPSVSLPCSHSSAVLIVPALSNPVPKSMPAFTPSSGSSVFTKSPGSLIPYVRTFINWPQAIILASNPSPRFHHHIVTLCYTRFWPLRVLWIRLGSWHSQHLEWLFHRELPRSGTRGLSFLHSVSSLRAGTTSQPSLCPQLPSRAPGNERALKRCLVSELTFPSADLTVLYQSEPRKCLCFWWQWAPRGRGLLLIHLCILSTWHTVFRKCGGRRQQHMHFCYYNEWFQLLLEL